MLNCKHMYKCYCEIGFNMVQVKIYDFIWKKIISIIADALDPLIFEISVFKVMNLDRILYTAPQVQTCHEC